MVSRKHCDDLAIGIFYFFDDLLASRTIQITVAVRKTLTGCNSRRSALNAFLSPLLSLVGAVGRPPPGRNRHWFSVRHLYLHRGPFPVSCYFHLKKWVTTYAASVGKTVEL